MHFIYSTYLFVLCNKTCIRDTKNDKSIDFLQNEANKEEFEGNTVRSTAEYKKVREDASTGFGIQITSRNGLYKKSDKKILFC